MRVGKLVVTVHHVKIRKRATVDVTAEGTQLLWRFFRRIPFGQIDMAECFLLILRLNWSWKPMTCLICPNISDQAMN